MVKRKKKSLQSWFSISNLIPSVLGDTDHTESGQSRGGARCTVLPLHSYGKQIGNNGLAQYRFKKKKFRATKWRGRHFLKKFRGLIKLSEGKKCLWGWGILPARSLRPVLIQDLLLLYSIITNSNPAGSGHPSAAAEAAEAQWLRRMKSPRPPAPTTAAIWISWKTNWWNSI